MKKIWVLIFCLNFVFVFGQKQETHVVAKGETLYAIAKKYEISPDEILKLNPEASAGIKENQTLMIPTKIIRLSTPTRYKNNVETDAPIIPPVSAKSF